MQVFAAAYFPTFHGVTLQDTDKNHNTLSGVFPMFLKSILTTIYISDINKLTAWGMIVQSLHGDITTNSGPGDAQVNLPHQTFVLGSWSVVVAVVRKVELANRCEAA